MSLTPEPLGPNPFAEEGPRRELWERASLVVAEHDATWQARYLDCLIDDNDRLPVLLDMCSERYDIRADAFLNLMISGYSDVARYEEALARLVDWIVLWVTRTAVERVEPRLLPRLRHRLAQRRAHWTHQALRLARAESDADAMPSPKGEVAAAQPPQAPPTTPDTDPSSPQGEAMAPQPPQATPRTMAVWLASYMAAGALSVNSIHEKTGVDPRSIKRALDGEALQRVVYQRIRNNLPVPADVPDGPVR